MTWSGRPAARLRALVILRDGGVCHLCGRPGATTADHLVPRSIGGRDTLENLAAAHLSCNASRGVRPVLPSNPSRRW